MLDKLVNLYKKNCNIQSTIKKYIEHNKKFFPTPKKIYSQELKIILVILLKAKVMFQLFTILIIK